MHPGRYYRDTNVVAASAAGTLGATAAQPVARLGASRRWARSAQIVEFGVIAHAKIFVAHALARKGAFECISFAESVRALGRHG